MTVWRLFPKSQSLMMLLLALFLWTGAACRPVVASPPPAAGQVRATSVTLPTYPMDEFQQPTRDDTYAWPYLRFDRDAFWASAPQPRPREYRVIELENAYLRVSILPELGGRIWQIVHKPSGNRMFYQNTVVKPSPWGPAQQLGWLALGGLEWALPVNEHGYDWGTPWQVTTFQDEAGSVGAVIATPEDGRLVSAQIVVTLPPDAAAVVISPTIRSHATQTLDAHVWQTAMLAPGKANQPSADLHFVLPNSIMTVHSTGDERLPGPGRLFTWPRYLGRDLSHLRNWDEYAGFFEYPTAHGPFVGVYDRKQDAGAVRIFPPQIATGSKVFGLGWQTPIGSEHFTDDGSFYVELHGGLSPTFDEPYRLAPGEVVTWAERWYPVHGMGDLTYANEAAALHLARTVQGWRVTIYTPGPFRGALTVTGADGSEVTRPVQTDPAAPWVADLPEIHAAQVTLRLMDATGAAVLAYPP
jgi:hypothetical protein